MSSTLSLIPAFAIPRSSSATIRPFSPGVHTLTEPYRPKSGETIDLTGVTLRHVSNTKLSGLIDVIDVEGVIILGGTFDANVQGQSSWNEWLHAIRVLSSENVKIEGSIFQNLSGDGIYISQRTPTSLGSRDVDVLSCQFNGANANRQGISIITATDVLIQKNVFVRMTRPDMPGAIDLEPDNPSQIIDNVRILENTILGSSPRGVSIANGKGGTINNILIEGNQIERTKIGVLLRGSSRSNEWCIVQGNDFIKCRVGIEIKEMHPRIRANGFRGCKTRIKKHGKKKRG